MKKQNIHYLLILLSVLSLLFAVHIGSTLFKRAKIDTTQERLYTLSEGTKKVLSKLSVPMKIKLYYSKTAANKGTEGLRRFNSYYNYVRDLLQEYAANSNNYLTVKIVDPRPDTKEEEEAITSGLKKFQLTETETYFFGMVVESENGTEKVIEFLDPNDQENVEYNITRLIYVTMRPQKKQVGILSSLPVLSDDVNPYMAQIMRMQGKNPETSWVITELMKEFYEVVKIPTDTKEISGVDILMIVHPKNFSPQTLFAIDQFMVKGGKILLLVDAHTILDNSEQMMGMPPQGLARSDLGPLMAKWGVELKADKLVGDRALAGMAQLAPNTPPMKLLPLMLCNNLCVAPYKDAISSRFEKFQFIFPGGIEVAKVEGLEATTFLSTTEKGNYYSATPMDLQNPAALFGKFSDGSRPISLGVRVVGKFASAYPDGITVEEGGEKDKTKVKMTKLTGEKEATKESAMVVISDVDFLNDRFAFQSNMFGLAAINDNSKLVLNALELLAGSSDLMSIRSKSKVVRSFDRIDAIEREAEGRTADKVEMINGKIARFTQELEQLSGAATRENISLIRSEGVRKRQDLEKQIALLRGELRDVKRLGRERVEFIGQILELINTLLVPLALVLLGSFFYYRKVKKNS